MLGCIASIVTVSSCTADGMDNFKNTKSVNQSQLSPTAIDSLTINADTGGDVTIPPRP